MVKRIVLVVLVMCLPLPKLLAYDWYTSQQSGDYMSGATWSGPSSPAYPLDRSDCAAIVNGHVITLATKFTSTGSSTAYIRQSYIGRWDGTQTSGNGTFDLQSGAMWKNSETYIGFNNQGSGGYTGTMYVRAGAEVYLNDGYTTARTHIGDGIGSTGVLDIAGRFISGDDLPTNGFQTIVGANSGTGEMYIRELADVDIFGNVSISSGSSFNVIGGDAIIDVNGILDTADGATLVFTEDCAGISSIDVTGAVTIGDGTVFEIQSDGGGTLTTTAILTSAAGISINLANVSVTGGSLSLNGNTLEATYQTCAPACCSPPSPVVDTPGMTVFMDAETGRRVWQMTHSTTRHNIHGYYDTCPWNSATGEIVFSSAENWHVTGNELNYRDGVGSVWIMDPNGYNLRCVAESQYFVCEVGVYPRWSPDGTMLLYGASGYFDIYDLASDTTTRDNELRSNNWHPDSNSISCTYADKRDVVIYSLADESYNLIVDFDDIKYADPDLDPNKYEWWRSAAHLNWRPDGSGLMFRTFVTYDTVEYKMLYVMNADGSGLSRVKNSLPDDWFHLTWHPSEEKLMFAVGYYGATGKIYTIKPDGTDLTVVAEGVAGHPAYNPDGSLIVTEWRYNGLYLVDASTGETEKLVSLHGQVAQDATDQHAVWSHDGNYIMYNDSDDSGTWQIYVIPMVDYDGDFDGDDDVDLNDLAFMVENWLSPTPQNHPVTGKIADITGDGDVDNQDFIIVGQNW